MDFRYIKILLVVFICSYTSIFPQGIKINEVSSSNSQIISDIDGDYPDWIELYNSSNESINLSSFFISDDIDELDKWQFPNIELEPDSLLLIFASGKDRSKIVEHWETVIREGDNCRYFIPQSTTSNEWKALDFNDTNWSMGPTGIGYSDNDDNTIIAQTTTAYLRCEFTIDDISNVNGLLLNVDFDDGFVAFLNGQEIARENLGAIGSPVSYNTFATSDHEAQLYQGNPPNAYPIDDRINLLQNGKNVLAMEVHNVNNNSSDLTIIPFLSVGYNSTPSNSRGTLDFLNLQDSNLHTNFKLNANGDFLIISNLDGDIEDSLYTLEQITDVSLGRYPNGSENLFFFNSPTPGIYNLDNGITKLIEPPVFSSEKGFYTIPFFLDISHPNSIGTIKYTLDGSEPDENSTTYFNQLVISQTAVIRAKVFASGFPASKTVTNTFFVNQEQRLPIISLTTNPEHFFDADSGIYVMGPNAEVTNPHYGANFWQNWERPIHLEFFEENNVFGFETDLGVKIFGQWSRANSQKSLALYARGSYGKSTIDYQLFPDSEINKYQSFVLRNSGTDWWYSLIRDALTSEIVEQLDVDRQLYRPVVVYLNGEYWGIHNLREKISEHFIASHHKIPEDDINIIENNIVIVKGDEDTYTEFYNSLYNLDMSAKASFDYIKSKIDVEEYIDYYLTEIFIDNQDWPGNNIKFWQQKSTNSKWRWILYDTDFGFGLFNRTAYNQNTLEFALKTDGPNWPNPPWSTFLLRKFLENDIFKQLFISRFSVYTNTIFSSNSINKTIDKLSAKINKEMPYHLSRWGGNYNNWVSEITRLRTFAYYRPTYISLYFKSYFNLQSEYKLSISSDNSKGSVEINDFEISDENWSGKFFSDIPIKLLAQPKPEFTFSHWEGTTNSLENPIVLTPNEDITISPVFVEVSDTQIVINEINYNSSDFFNPDDWIELYNYSDKTIDISGWVFMDEDPEPFFILPENTLIKPNDFVILCRDTLLFKSKFPEADNYYGDFGFGLSGGGELIRLYNNNGFLIDSLTYEDKEPWPSLCDGGGPTLELSYPLLDNSNHIHWQPSYGYGTPGMQNSVFTNVDSNVPAIPTRIELFQNYPNPFNPTTSISYSIPSDGKVEIKVYNLLGQEIQSLVNESQKAGSYSVKVFGSSTIDGLPSGVYIYRMKFKDFVKSRKMILLK